MSRDSKESPRATMCLPSGLLGNSLSPASSAAGVEPRARAMARTVIVFRDTMIERERLAESQAAANRERENRGEVIAATITRFEMSVDQALSRVREAAGARGIVEYGINKIIE